MPKLNERLQRKLKACSDLPTLPAIAARVIELAEDPTASMSDISSAVKLDPALVAKLLRIANSPLYARSRQISNLNQAVMILGLNSTIMLALSFSLTASMKGRRPAGFDYARFWRRSLLAAVVARVTAAKLEDVPVEDAFLAAMMRGVGLIALDRVGADVPVAELHALTAAPVSVSAWLLDQWHFPMHLVNAIKDSQDCDRLNKSAPENDLARAVHLSWRVADIIFSDDKADDLDYVCDFVGRHWQADRSWVGRVLGVVADELPEIEKLFEMDLLDSSLLEGLLAQAKELMVIRSLHTAQALESKREETELMAQKARAMEAQFHRDHLTGLWNRAHLDQVIKTTFEASNEDDTPLSVIFLDLDHFKQVNDQHGHGVGDEALKHAANVLISNTHSRDVVARYGGEEFVLVLPGLDGETATGVANRLVRAIRKTPLKTDTGVTLCITASAGVATHNDKHQFEHPESLMRAADQVMYMAKSNGRDRFVTYSKCM